MTTPTSVQTPRLEPRADSAHGRAIKYSHHETYRGRPPSAAIPNWGFTETLSHTPRPRIISHAVGSQLELRVTSSAACREDRAVFDCATTQLAHAARVWRRVRGDAARAAGADDAIGPRGMRCRARLFLRRTDDSELTFASDGAVAFPAARGMGWWMNGSLLSGFSRWRATFRCHFFVTSRRENLLSGRGPFGLLEFGALRLCSWRRSGSDCREFWNIYTSQR